MLKVSNIDVWGFEGAIRGMRNPKNSWEKSDSLKCGISGDQDCPMALEGFECVNCVCPDKSRDFCIGLNDLKLMKQLNGAGSEHRKFLRMIHAQMDVLAPLYWWKEYDTYKIATTANSCSTMHYIHKKKFTLEDFSTEHLNDLTIEKFRGIINTLNENREKFIETNDKEYWWQMIQLLPSSYNQLRTIDINYETVLNIIHQRKGHKLDEWHLFIDELMNLPFVKELIDE